MYLRDYGKEHNPNSNEYGEDNEDDENNEKHHLGEVFKRENLPALGAATLVSYRTCRDFTLAHLSPDPHSVWCGLLFNLCVDGNLHGCAVRGAN